MSVGALTQVQCMTGVKFTVISAQADSFCSALKPADSCGLQVWFAFACCCQRMMLTPCTGVLPLETDELAAHSSAADTLHLAAISTVLAFQGLCNVTVCSGKCIGRIRGHKGVQWAAVWRP